MTTLFISDLHLDKNRPLVTEAFFSFLQREARRADALYILGDLFDAWIGDDDDSALVHSTAEALNELRTSGTAILFQHGNRDFLLGNAFATRAGMELLPECHVIERGTQRWLLAHGDQFCTHDTAYQQFRSMVRNPGWQKEILAKSLGERRQLAAALREKSREANSLKAEDIMDVTPEVIIETMRLTGCQTLIHGHTHRPARHSLVIEGRPAERIVLGEWHHSFWYLRERDSKFELIEQAVE